MTKVAPGDFLRRRAVTPLRERFLAAGAVCELSTNYTPILEAARETFIPGPVPCSRPLFRLRFWVDETLASKPPWPKPYIRGLGHLIFSGLDSQNSFLVDRTALRAIGRFSPAMAADQDYWRAVIFPLVVSLFGGSIGSTELHCGCVASNGSGVLLAGTSGSGKSTLSWALARRGYSFISDDRTHISRHGGKLLAWGVSPSLKMRPDSVTLFPELNRLVPSALSDGEEAIRFEPEREFEAPRSRSCRPLCVIFLDRRPGARFSMMAMTPPEAARELSRDLLAEAAPCSELQLRTIEELARTPCWRLLYGVNLDVTAQRLARFCEVNKESSVPSRWFEAGCGDSKSP